MPLYSFRKNDGSLLELSMPLAEYDKRVKKGVLVLDDGTKAVRDIAADWQNHIECGNERWPMESRALGCPAGEMETMARHCEAAGVTTQFVRRGPIAKAVIESRAHQRELCRIRGMYNADAGYGDAMPT